MGQGPRALSYIEPQIKVIRAMGQGPRAPRLAELFFSAGMDSACRSAVTARRAGPQAACTKQSMLERRGRRGTRPHPTARHEGHFNGATKPESIPARHRAPSRGNLNTSASSAAHCCCPSSSAPDGYRCTRCRTPPRTRRGRGPTCARTPHSSSPRPSRGP